MRPDDVVSEPVYQQIEVQVRIQIVRPIGPRTLNFLDLRFGSEDTNLTGFSVGLVRCGSGRSWVIGLDC